ncbi:MAG: 4Fe-4S dicluster domain-containing protein [Candidatus Bathyarchaeota archaeon]|nr:4Fe-4S dicluster domain-containing protein [Candidatus Bathyarchaeota archaeon]
MYKKLAKEELYGFFESLKKMGKVYAPVSIGGSSYDFKEVSSPNEADLTYTRTMIPPKKFFVKTKEKIFDFDEEKAKFREPKEEEGITVVLGIHPCDIHAVKLLDKVYMDETPDKYYVERRENTVLVGVDCHPDENCFCKSTGTSYVADGFDLFLHEISGGYFVRVGSERGYQIIEGNKNLFKDAGAKDAEEFKLNEKKRQAEFKLDLNVLGLQDMLDMSYDNPVWKETADECLGCGTCNLTCPTCRCYDVVDNVGLDLKTGERVRRWDSCMLRKHGLVAGGLNFRPTRVERLLNRFNCKGSLREGMLNCVGCGRCTVYCPADIDFVEIMKKVRGEL